MSAAMYSPSVDLSPAAYARRLQAARRRVEVARARADRNPTPANQEAAAELEAGLRRIEQAATA
ncbi:hypothetical protein [Arthrobacter sp. SD76]|uniref:hypothetical protein n=1 Tax=Arthrobacter sp. SD76 TaxID=3415007 RepID=UPI003C7116F8